MCGKSTQYAPVMVHMGKPYLEQGHVCACGIRSDLNALVGRIREMVATFHKEQNPAYCLSHDMAYQTQVNQYERTIIFKTMPLDSTFFMFFGRVLSFIFLQWTNKHNKDS